MITSQVVFPIKIASTFAPKGILGEDFDKEIDEILNSMPEERRIPAARGEHLSTIRTMSDVLTLPSTKNFNQWVKEIIPSLWEEVGYAPADLAVERSWINQFSQGSLLRAHAHGSTEMVMTYYHRIPEGSGSITFYNPFDVSTGMAPFKQKTLTIKPEEGLLLAWPGFLWHEVHETSVNKKRMAISMHVHQGSYTLADRWRETD